MLPYYEIRLLLATLGGTTDESVEFELNDDELYIKRKAQPALNGYPEVPEVFLNFTIDQAVELRDFLNFALRPYETP